MAKVNGMESYKGTGNIVANQYDIRTNDGRYFQSYDTIVAKIDNKGQVYINKEYYNHGGWISNTTCNYLRQFLGTSDTKKEIEAHIKSGRYKLANLDK